jgi:hypothetical protein
VGPADPSDLNLKLNKYTSSSLPLTFLMGRVFLTIFNKIKDVTKKFSLLGKNTQFLKRSISKTAACTKFAWTSNCSNFFGETHILRDIEQKLKIVQKFCYSLATTQRAQVFRSCKFGVLLLVEIQTTY